MLLLLVVFVLSACASTRITAVWKDPSYQQMPRKVLVIGVARKAANRRIFEDEFVARLKEHGTDAVASYSFIPDRKQENRQLIEAKVKELGTDAVLITRMVERKTLQRYVPGSITPRGAGLDPWWDHYPPYYGTWHDYYGFGSRMVYTPGYIEEEQYALMETNLYNARDSRLVWSASSETEIRGSDQKMISSFIQVMVRTMIEQNVL
jgi:hypothetical protein